MNKSADILEILIQQIIEDDRLVRIVDTEITRKDRDERGA